MLSQHNVVGRAAQRGEQRRRPPRPGPTPARNAPAASRRSARAAPSSSPERAEGNANKCLTSAGEAQHRRESGTDLRRVVHRRTRFIAPTDPKTAGKLAKLCTKTEDKIAKKCGPRRSARSPASSPARARPPSRDLQECIICGGFNGVFDAVEQQYSEAGEFVEQRAWRAAARGGHRHAAAAATPARSSSSNRAPTRKRSPSSRAATTSQLVGCGGATNDRPRIIPPVARKYPAAASRRRQRRRPALPEPRFLRPDQRPHLRRLGAGRDLPRHHRRRQPQHAPMRSSRCSSNDVLVELCRVRAQDDAPIYVGQSSTIIVRYNDVRDGVAGIEIENSGNAQVYGNYGTGQHRRPRRVQGQRPAGAADRVPPGAPQPVRDQQRAELRHRHGGRCSRGNWGPLHVRRHDALQLQPAARQRHDRPHVHHAGPRRLQPAERADRRRQLLLQQLDDGQRHRSRSGQLAAAVRLRFRLPRRRLEPATARTDNIFGTELGFAVFAAPPNIGACMLPPPAVFPGCPAPSIP